MAYLNDPPPEDDSDLEDLLSHNDREKRSILNSPPSRRVSMIDFTLAYISVLVMKKPRLACCMVIFFLLCLFLMVNMKLSNGTNISLDSIVENDYSSIQSKYDLKLGSIDHWCLKGGNEKCRCEDPLQPMSRWKEGPIVAWERSHTKNKDLVQYAIKELGNIDVVFLGENITELWAGKASSLYYDSNVIDEISDKFWKKFGMNRKEQYNGISLGISGDTAPNVLWRIQNGEIPRNLNPKIFWLVLGTNDLALRQCSEEVVLLGILRVIEEIQEMKPNTKIVLNSILPMTTDAKGRLPEVDGNRMEKGLKRNVDARRSLVGVSVPWSSTVVDIWPSVVMINKALKKFCSKHKHIIFFDVYDIFVDDQNGKMRPTIDSELMKISTLGMPTVSGHEKLLDSIQLKLKHILS